MMLIDHSQARVSGITAQGTSQPLNSPQYLQRVGNMKLLSRASLRVTDRSFTGDGIRYFHTRHCPTTESALVLAESEKTTLTAEGASPWCQLFICRRGEQVTPHTVNIPMHSTKMMTEKRHEPRNKASEQQVPLLQLSIQYMYRLKAILLDAFRTDLSWQPFVNANGRPHCRATTLKGAGARKRCPSVWIGSRLSLVQRLLFTGN
jgi:hypothetical protein